MNEAAGERESERLLGKREGGERKSYGRQRGYPGPRAENGEQG